MALWRLERLRPQRFSERPLQLRPLPLAADVGQPLLQRVEQVRLERARAPLARVRAIGPDALVVEWIPDTLAQLNIDKEDVLNKFKSETRLVSNLAWCL